MGTSVEDLTGRARELLTSGQHQEAVRACRRVLLSRPKLVEARLLLGRALLALKRHEEARVEMTTALRHSPDEAAAHCILGEALLRAGQRDKARDALERALELDAASDARGLLQELGGAPPPDKTVDRWFEAEAPATSQTELPEFAKDAADRETDSFVDDYTDDELPGVFDKAPPAPVVMPAAAPTSSRPPPPPRPSSFPPPRPPSTASRPPPPPHIGSRPPPRTSANTPTSKKAQDSTQEIDLDDIERVEGEQLSAPRVPTELRSPGVPPRRSQPAMPPSAPVADLESVPTTVRSSERPLPPGPRPTMPRPPDPDRTFQTGHGLLHRLASLPKLVIALVALLPIALGVAALAGVLSWKSAREAEAVREGAMQASNMGTSQALREAIALVEDYDDDEPESLALRARLLSVAVLEHGDDRGDEVTALLAALGAEAETLADARVASAYLSLAAGDVAAAQSAISRTLGEGAEVSRARALAAMRARDFDRALAEARRADTLSSNGPRHAALLAWLTAATGDRPAALAALDSVPNGSASPAVRVARARILEAAGQGAEAATEAAAVLTDLAEASTPYQKGWAHLVRAQRALDTFDAVAARTELARAVELRAPRDEESALVLASLSVAVGDLDGASAVLDALPEASQQPELRSRLRAEVFLGSDDHEAAAVALATAGNSGAALLLRGRLAEAEDRRADAVRLYTRAATDGHAFVEAKLRLGRLQLTAGRRRRAAAVVALTAAHERAPANVEVVQVLAPALMDAGKVNDAAQVVRAALAARGQTPELLVMRAHVEMAQDNPDGALSTMRSVVEMRPGDATLHVELGDVARRAGESAEARTAYQRALELRPGEPLAFSGIAELALDEGDLEQAATTLANAADATADDIRLSRARARLLVLQGAGAAAIDTVRGLARSARDALLWVYTGRLQSQAEADRDASRSFVTAMRFDRRSPEAQLGLVLVRTRAGELSSAQRTVASAEAEANRRHLGSGFLARVGAARARLSFERGDFDEASRLASEAAELDSTVAAAHLVQANVAMERGTDPVPSLRRAVAGLAPPPEAVGRLATRVRGAERCELARRYIAAAPQGYDATDVRPLLARCR